MVRHWHELCGFFLAPRRTEPKIVVLRGTGSNGKTKLMGTVAKVMGEDLVLISELKVSKITALPSVAYWARN